MSVHIMTHDIMRDEASHMTLEGGVGCTVLDLVGESRVCV